MRIAMVSPPWIPVPPQGYGGIEWVVHLLVEELVRRGHDVTLFATGDSTTKAELRYVFEEAQTPLMHQTMPDALHVGSAYRHVAEEARAGRPYDVVHDHTAWLGVAFAPLVPSPVVHTIHGAFIEANRIFYGGLRDHALLVTISEYQQKDFPEIAYAGVVPNAVDVASLPYRARKDGYLLALGRIARDKGQAIAVRVAREAGIPLVLAGKVDPGNDRAYFEEAILPFVDGASVRFEGEVPNARKSELLAGARAMLFPVQWAEPFGLVMIEAMACGTPVIAIRNGSVPEILADGETGFIVEDEAGMLAALDRVEEISPERCRREAEERFSPERMADRYLEIYERATRRPRA
ncbi:MAG: glycosyltransferase family 4 protein [Acidobacteria bacterium]|nr:glycosyltransferase family 4 protein [Acidobacteriota bacterium]